ncbi:MAG: hypothetical protein JXB49_04930 [Bacteroidales bacterium]|nr:hypothetical protein [Bacteroidales bacterium]
MYKLKNQIIILSVIFTLIISFPLNATTYYVSNSGNDGANGTSPATAWKTIARVNITNLLPGDSVLFEAGGCWRNTDCSISGNMASI